MRSIIAVHLLALALAGTTQMCGGQGETYPPEILAVSFPEVIPGDGSEQFGTIAFEDPDAGVRYALLEIVECPDGFSCQDQVFDLVVGNPDILTQTEGIIDFSLSCNNPTGQDATFVYSWTLIDTSDHQSAPVPFTHTCLPKDTNPVPIITDLIFPTEIQGNGVPSTGTLSFADANAGIIYARIDNLVCPSGWECPEYTYDMLAIDPNFDTYTAGDFTFFFECLNTSDTDVYFQYQWTLEDVEGHISNAAQFGFTCITQGQGFQTDQGDHVRAGALSRSEGTQGQGRQSISVP